MYKIRVAECAQRGPGPGLQASGSHYSVENALRASSDPTRLKAKHFMGALIFSRCFAFQALRFSPVHFKSLQHFNPERPLRFLKMATLWTTDHGATVINLGKRESAAVNMMQYGRMQGNPQLCKQISDWIHNESGREPPAPDHIMITTGSGPAMATVCQLFTKPGDVVFIDSPAYFLSFYTFKDAQVKVVEIPTDSYGLDVNEIERRLKLGERPSLIYTVPIANNPTGVSMTAERKTRLVELAREYNFMIAADEVYQFLSFQDELPTSLFEYDDPSNPKVLAVNSFSKLLGPGLRLGWLTAHKPHMERLLQCGSLQSGGGFNPLTSSVVSEMILSGTVTRHIKHVRDHYKTTCAILVSEIETTLQSALLEGETLTFQKPTGGFFMFITLPERIDAEKLLGMAMKRGVSFFAGRHSSLDKSQFRHAIRLCFAFIDEDGIREGVRRLAEAVRAYE